VLWAERIDPRLVFVRLEALDGNLLALSAASSLRDAEEAIYLFDVHGDSDSDVGDGTQSAAVHVSVYSAGRPVNGTRACLSLCECTRRNHPQG